MIALYGFPVSNYYNKVKLILLEKDIPFKEELVYSSQDPSLLERSPLGKVPFIETGKGYLSESQVIIEYLDEVYPDPPLYPADAFARAKCRELIQHLELNIELVIRRVYKEAFFGGVVSEETKAEAKGKFEAGLRGLARLAAFSPHICGNGFTAADCAAWAHFELMALASQAIYGEDLIARYVPAVTAYLQMLEQRPEVQRVAVDRAAALKAFFARQ